MFRIKTILNILLICVKKTPVHLVKSPSLPRPRLAVYQRSC
jgi:hypothetical protein